MIERWMTGVLLVTLAAASAGAKDRDPDAGSSPLLQALGTCRDLADTERLRCYDAAVAKIDAAVARKTVVVIDRSELAQSRRQDFGKLRPDRGLPGLSEDEADVSRIEGVVKAASLTRAGVWSILLVDGSVWRQTDDVQLGREPTSGDKVIVRKAALGSFKMKIGIMPAIRVRRLA